MIRWFSIRDVRSFKRRLVEKQEVECTHVFLEHKSIITCLLKIHQQKTHSLNSAFAVITHKHTQTFFSNNPDKWCPTFCECVYACVAHQICVPQTDYHLHKCVPRTKNGSYIDRVGQTAQNIATLNELQRTRIWPSSIDAPVVLCARYKEKRADGMPTTLIACSLFATHRWAPKWRPRPPPHLCVNGDPSRIAAKRIICQRGAFETPADIPKYRTHAKWKLRILRSGGHSSELGKGGGPQANIDSVARIRWLFQAIAFTGFAFSARFFLAHTFAVVYLSGVKSTKYRRIVDTPFVRSGLRCPTTSGTRATTIQRRSRHNSHTRTHTHTHTLFARTTDLAWRAIGLTKQK